VIYKVSFAVLDFGFERGMEREAKRAAFEPSLPRSSAWKPYAVLRKTGALTIGCTSKRQ
jgi:hypothetical protein